MLTLMMLWCMAFQQHPTYSQTNVGQYVEIVNVQYDAQSNQTYGVLERYGIDVPSQPYLLLMQPRPFVGHPSKADMLKTVEVLPYITKVE